MRLEVKAILPGGGAGDFRLDAQSARPRNIFIAREWLAERLGRDGMSNTLLASTQPGASQHAGAVLASAIARHATLLDYGLTLAVDEAHNRMSLAGTGTTLTTAQRFALTAALAPDAKVQTHPMSVYLATRIHKSDEDTRELAYAMIASPGSGTGFEFAAGGGNKLSPKGIWLNTWAAEDLGANVGDRLVVSYLVPTDDGTYPTAQVELRLEGIVKISGAAIAADLVPEFEGITDAEGVDEWDPPFAIDLDRITQRDEDYWDRYNATPKGFVSLAVVKAMWQSGGNADYVTSVRIDPPEGDSVSEAGAAELTRDLLGTLGERGTALTFHPVRENALAASQGTSDFGQLFLGLSMFLVFSGAGLAGTLLRLSVDRRASEAGIMLACGCGDDLVRSALFAEGAVMTALGTLLGVPAGLGYAAVILHALSSWWGGALGATSALWLHVTPTALVIGGLSGIAVGLGTAYWSTRRIGRAKALELLAGRQAMDVAPTPRRGIGAMVLFFGMLMLAVVLGALSTVTETVPPEGAFFGIGFALLVAGLSGTSLTLTRTLYGVRADRSLVRLALRNASASRRRSLLVVGLLAAASFVIVAVAANTRDLSGIDTADRASGTGGFSLLATSSIPLPYDLSTPAGRANLGFPAEDESVFEGTQIISFLASPGEDISCLNISRPTRPRILGVPDAMAERGGFSPQTVRDWASPWHELVSDPTASFAFGDADSVRWTLHGKLGEPYYLTLPNGQTERLNIAGLMPGSIFQSELLVGESTFRGLYPSITAPSYFLIDAPPERQDQVAEALRRNLGDLGVVVRSTREVLNAYMQVQNTYLSMFLALGGLGLLLGTVGLVSVLLRSALERRSELALMLATGFDRPRLAWLLLIENGGLLLLGMACGAVSALIAVMPQLRSAVADVNWASLSGVLGAIVLTGLITCVLAAYATVRGPLIPALRRE